MNHIKGTWQISISKYFHFPGKIHVHQSVENKSCYDSETCHVVEALRAPIIWRHQDIPSVEGQIITFYLSYHQ